MALTTYTDAATRTNRVQPAALSPSQAADFLGVCRATIYNLHRKGELRFFKVGASTRIPLADLEALVGGDAA